MTKEEFYDQISYNTHLDENFLKSLHAYSLYDPQYLIDVMRKFDSMGRKRASDIFTLYMYLYEEKRRQELLPAARRLRKQIDGEYERKKKEYEKEVGEKLRKQTELDHLIQKRELLKQKLKK